MNHQKQRPDASIRISLQDVSQFLCDILHVDFRSISLKPKKF